MEHFLHRIARRARDSENVVALRIVHDSSGATRDLTWGQVARRAWSARKRLLDRGLVPGDRVLLLLPTGEAYVTALFGAFWAGLVPTTLYPLAAPGAVSEHEILDLIAAFRPRAVVAPPGQQGLESLIIPPDHLVADRDEEVPEAVDVSCRRSPCYVQYTSGSTGRPRGLVLTWEAIEANIDAISRATDMGPGQRVVSWLPMYHDMGIFGGLMTTLWAGAELTLMDPGIFVANPLVWLRVMHEKRATITVTPPSALRACLDLLRRRSRKDLDLSSLEQVICGAEPVSPELKDVFAETLGPCGVPGTALRPVYGLAEATLAVSFTPLGRGARIDSIERRSFEKTGLALPASDAGALRWVSAGPALPGIDVRIVDENSVMLPERRTGEVWIRSPSLYAAVLEDGGLRSRDEEWLDTGDLGYLAEGELYVTGRRKDLIIKNGRNYSPERIEQLAGRIDGVRRCAAFGVFDQAKSTERIVLMLETPARNLEDAEVRDRLRLAVRGQLSEAGYQIDEIQLLPRGSLPITTSGKVRRGQCRATYLSQSVKAS